MLVFVDESGDTGMRLEKRGTSQFFVVTAVIFEDREEAEACDEAIKQLRESLGWRVDSEFHFSRLNREHRLRFLSHVAEFQFFYFSIVLNKAKLTGPGFQFKDPFNKYAVNLVFQNAKPHLTNATVIIDGKGELRFRRELQAYLKKRVNDEDQSVIRKVKLEASHTNNLLQLADIVCGAIARSLQPNKPDARDYRRVIRHREIKVQVWPR